ncbi:hypothetical protein QZM22_12840 [Burkholderia oklahomensis]|uniref:hypothetical protein n=1 Tax=Burkholderia oklahomensis TaxID=342113 RepID=UPI00264F8BB3|nr:hypothetical protein [Burkholderia oklahomensis]MDN7673385.1 hypothetical protein [Burkholderia oklahomensis]
MAKVLRLCGAACAARKFGEALSFERAGGGSRHFVDPDPLRGRYNRRFVFATDSLST